jgi:ppGpp synthetase/RelA/SpoT-type nucleotidyltranferase
MKYDELKKYYDENSSNMNEILNRIEKDIIDARDKKGIPIYMTRARVKDIDSCYLKTKRKNKVNISTITDMIGLRILCLFEQDIFDVYKYLLTMFDKKVYTLNEILVYGWKQDSIIPIEFMENEIKKFTRYHNISFEDIYRDNGYQSIHFVGKYMDFHHNIEYSFEIQLRTLLQDVWGELEHKLAYKQKNPHQFIKQSFMRLSKSLETNDMLITHLKSFIDESLCGIDPIPFSVGNVYKYEYEILPNIFYKEQIKPLFDEYNQLLFEEDFLKSVEKIEKAYQVYNDLVSLCMHHDPSQHNDKSFIYWKDMEKAFFNLINNNFDEAIPVYEKYLRESYVSAFRLGQIYFYKQNYIEALKKFDYCFEILDEESLQINKMKLYVNMALVFWNLGSEYLISSIESTVKFFQPS